jgi:hypothetical protein
MSDYLHDNAGNRVPPGVASGAPVLATGVTITDAAVGADHTETLTAGKTYKIMVTATGGFLLGVATTATAANILWFVEAGGVACFTLPIGYGTLHYQGLVNDSTAYIVELK